MRVLPRVHAQHHNILPPLFYATRCRQFPRKEFMPYPLPKTKQEMIILEDG